MESSATIKTGPRIISDLLDCFNKQMEQNNFPIPFQPFTLDNLSPRPMLLFPPSPTPSPPAAPSMVTQLEEQQRQKLDNALVVGKLLSTVALYEEHTDQLTKMLEEERERYRVATRDLQVAHEAFTDEVARIDWNVREVLAQRDEENLRLRHDLNLALATVQRSQRLCEELQQKAQQEREERQSQEDKCQRLEQQLDKMSAALCELTERMKSPKRSLGQKITGAASKLVHFGCVVAVGVAAFLHWGPGANLYCDYERRAPLQEEPVCGKYSFFNLF